MPNDSDTRMPREDLEKLLSQRQWLRALAGRLVADSGRADEIVHGDRLHPRTAAPEQGDHRRPSQLRERHQHRSTWPDDDRRPVKLPHHA